jgi:hypothetical protein
MPVYHISVQSFPEFTLHLKHMRIRTVEVYVPERKCKRSRATVFSEAHPPKARE